MVYINNISINGRHNRPSVLSKTALITYFFNDGQAYDPYRVSAVSIFNASANFEPSSVIGNDGQIKNSASSFIKMNFANSATDGADPTTSSFDTSNYFLGNTATSGIYKLRTGVYACILDPNFIGKHVSLSAAVGDGTNTVSGIGSYIDVWTLKRAATSDLDTIVNDFDLHQDRFTTTTEPLLFRVATRLENTNIVLGSKVPLKFTNEFTIENCNIDKAVINLFKESFILNPAIEIWKENEDRNLAARVSVSGFTDTSSLCDLTSEDTVIFNFDTSKLVTHASYLDGTLGAQTGVYVARLKFSAIDEIHYSNYFRFIVR